mgnify:CR=1 FL=1
MRRLISEMTTYLSLSFAGMVAVLLAHGLYLVAHVYGPLLAIIVGAVILLLLLALFILPPVGLVLKFMHSRYPKSKATFLVERLRENVLNLLH